MGTAAQAFLIVPHQYYGFALKANPRNHAKKLTSIDGSSWTVWGSEHWCKLLNHKTLIDFSVYLSLTFEHWSVYEINK